MTAPDADGVFWSALERAFGRGVCAAGLPAPRYNAPVRASGRLLYADALWEPQRLVAELHGLRFHAAPAQRRSDAERQSVFTLAGYRCLVFTWRDVFEDMPGVIAALATGLGVAQK